MSGQSIQYAATAASSLAEVFGRVLKCKVEVLGHTTAASDNGECPVLAVAKSFAAPATPEEVYTRLCGVRMRGNADGDALMFAAHRLAQRPEARKILILLADGQPTDAYTGDPASVMVMAIDTIERMGIHTAGIGIMHEGIRHFFKDAEVIESPDQVGRAVLKTAERFVLKN
jgi:cobalamin biosynthesis protein CobT